MPTIFTPQVDWLLKETFFCSDLTILDFSWRYAPDILPYGHKSFWKSGTYLSEGFRDFNNNLLPFDSIWAASERAVIHHALNIAVASTGSNPTVGGLNCIRAWVPNQDPKHPASQYVFYFFPKEISSQRLWFFFYPLRFYYGRNRITNNDLAKVTLPHNQSLIFYQPGCDCPTAGCCPETYSHTIPGNYFYRVISPTYILRDPLQGSYGWTWRASPAGPNKDPSQSWNVAGVIHWNDWKPITGENVWAAMIGPLQLLF